MNWTDNSAYNKLRTDYQIPASQTATGYTYQSASVADSFHNDGFPENNVPAQLDFKSRYHMMPYNPLADGSVRFLSTTSTAISSHDKVLKTVAV